MTSLTCPKCRNGMPEDALDAGFCPRCGFPLDGPVVLAAPGARVGGARLVLAVGAVAVLTVAVAGYAFFGHVGASSTQPAVEVAAVVPAELPPGAPVRHVAPFPHEPKRAVEPPPLPVPPGTDGDKGQPPVLVAKKAGPRPIGVGIGVDPKIAPKRHFDHPDDTVKVPDLNSGDRVTLTGVVRVLRLGAVNGKGVLDASGLVAEEIIITGDLSSESQVLVTAPNGTVTVGGYVAGAAKLTIVAPGGEVIVAGSGRLSGGSLVTATAKRLEVKCPMSDGARVNVTLTAGGSLKLTRMDDGSTVTYRKAVATDPPPVVEKGLLRDRARVIEAK